MFLKLHMLLWITLACSQACSTVADLPPLEVALTDAQHGESASAADCAIAATLLGAVFFQVTIFYFLHHRDPDMRRYTYEVLISMISIFCAVLLFTSINDLLGHLVLKDNSAQVALLVGLLQLIPWFGAMRIVLAYFSGSFSNEACDMKDTKTNIKYCASLLAHTTGFAAIHAVGTVQQLPMFSHSPLRSFLVIPFAVQGLTVVQRLLTTIHGLVIHSSTASEEAEEVYKEALSEADNEVIGVVLSFLVVQSIRYSISGILPNLEGEENEEEDAAHSMDQVVMLMTIGLLFLLTRAYIAYRSPEDEADEGFLHGWMFLHTALPMSFAWCIFFSADWCFATISIVAAHKMLQMVFLALAMSGLSLLCVRLLDLHADAESNHRVELAFRNVISAFAILPGFAWEKCFDEALVSVSSQFENKLVAKFGLGIICVSVIIPAWWYHMIPMLTHEGWRYGVVISDKNHLDELVKQHTEMEKKGKGGMNASKKRRPDVGDHGEDGQSKKYKTSDTETLRHRGTCGTGASAAQ